MARKQYHIYVIELDPRVLKARKVKDENPEYVEGMQCLYVGQTARTPEERFEQHKEGYKSNKYTKKYGLTHEGEGRGDGGEARRQAPHPRLCGLVQLTKRNPRHCGRGFSVSSDNFQR
jgi:hypothetical protein